MVSIWGSCLKLLRMTCSSCLLHFFLYLVGWDSWLELALASFSITISTFFYHACMFNSQRICARVGSTWDGKKLAKEWMCMGRNLLPIAWRWETHQGVVWMDFLKSSIDVWSTGEESFASFMVYTRILRKNLLLPC